MIGINILQYVSLLVHLNQAWSFGEFTSIITLAVLIIYINRFVRLCQKMLISVCGLNVAINYAIMLILDVLYWLTHVAWARKGWGSLC